MFHMCIVCFGGRVCYCRDDLGPDMLLDVVEQEQRGISERAYAGIISESLV